MNNRAENGTIDITGREIELSAHLPEYLMELREIKAVLNAEDPELRRLDGALREAAEAGFIEYCAEPFLARFESLIGIIPARGDSLDDRRGRVLIRWNESPPYTLEALREKLEIVCGEAGFSLSVHPESCSLDVKISVTSNAVLSEIERLLSRVVPANIVIRAENNVVKPAAGPAVLGGGISAHYCI